MTTQLQFDGAYDLGIAVNSLDRTAEDLIAKHGDDALDYALERASAAISHCDLFSSAVWRQLRAAIAHRLATAS